MGAAGKRPERHSRKAGHRRHHRKTLEKLLAKRIFPIVRVRVNGSGSFHYVLIVNSNGKEFRCMDPMNPSDSLVPLSDFGNRIYAVRYVYRE